MTIRTTLYSIALFFAAASGQQLIAQELPKVAPPSPEAASVFKFTEVPVSLYTGVPNITIPIYEIEANGLTVPISISYHSRGIQVSEIASRVGLGWSFNYGGMVSMQIRGIHDNSGQYGYLNVDSNSEDYFTNPGARASLLSYDIGQYDFVPDQYFFDANGINGKFILDKFNGAKPLVQHFSDIKVAGNSSGWGITDNRGNRYSFNATEYESTIEAYQAKEFNNQYTTPQVDITTSPTSSWLISKIITAQHDTIDYVYEDTQEITQFFRRSHDAREMVTDPFAPNGQPIPNGNYYVCNFSEISGHNSRLKRINFSKGHMLFSYEAREDLEGSGCLKNVKVYNKLGQKVKELHFEYEYTTDPYDPNHYSINQVLNGLDGFARKRLFLKSVQVLANSGPETMPSYRFEYDSIPLPNRHSNAQDFWGNYNGKNNGQYLKFASPVIGVKSVDTIKSGAGMLRKIIYPEGGSTTFTYEHNKVKNLAFPSHYIPTTVNPSSVRDVYLGLLDTIYHTSDGKFSKTFTVGENVIGHIKTDIDLFGNDSGCGTSPDNHTNQCRFAITIYKNGQLHTTLFKGVNQTTLEPGEYQLRVKVIPISGAFDLFDAVNNSFNVHLNWLELAAQNDSLIYAGGKRIKKIEYHDEHNNLGLSKTYDYSNPVTGATSGQLLGVTNYYAKNSSLPGWPLILEHYGCVPGGPLQTYQGNSLGYQTVTEYYGEGTTTIGKTEHHFSMVLDGGTYYKFPYHPPTDNEWLRGKEVLTKHFKLENGIYKKVREIDTKYVYGDHIISNPDGDPNDPLDVASTPAAFTPFIPFSFGQMTKLLSENFEEPLIYYDKTRTFFQVPLTIFAKYKDIYEPAAGANQWDNSLNEAMGYKTYFLNGGTVDLLTTKTTDFFDDGSSMAVRVNNGYHYAKHYNLANTRQYASDGSLKYVHYIYPQSVQMEGNAVAMEMIAKNMVGIPLRTQISDDSSVPIGSTLTTQETQYKNWGNDLLAPEIIKTSKGTTTPEIRIRYNAVDTTTGNPLEVQQEGGMKISYLWGYSKTLPIAKIENATNAEIKTALGVTDLTLVNEANLTAINNLRTSLPNAMVTTYTYTPLVGVTTITDPKGDKITYEYDSFNRLKLVRDRDNNILSENQYHYRPQN